MNVQVLEELIEHKLAPEPLVGVQGLVNTFSLEDQVELLGSPEEAREWLVGAELLDKDAKVTAGDLATLVDFREALRSVLLTNHDGGPPDPEVAAKLAGLAEKHPVSYVVTEEGGVSLDLAPARDVGALIGQSLGIIHQAQNLDQWRRLKICAADTCLWAFYDTSKNCSGTWCQMGLCGNRNKNRRYRSRA